MLRRIESPQNKEIKLVKSLSTRKGREKEEKFLAEGVRLLEAALKAGASFHAVFGCPELLKDQRAQNLWVKLVEQNEHCFVLPPRLFHEIAETDSPQGLLAVLSPPVFDLESLYKREQALLLVLDGVQDPGNFGTIIRTADAAGVQAVFYTAGTVDPYNPKVVRSTMGSLFHLPIIKLQEPAKEIEKWKRSGFCCYAAALEEAKDYFEVSIGPKSVFFLGNEANGLSKKILPLADVTVKIPILGKAESLNVAIAAGILVYEALRQRNYWK